VRLLLDTHVLIWWLTGRPLSSVALDAIGEEMTEVLVSAASVWEAEIKAASGKLDLRTDLVVQIRDNAFTELPVTFEHATTAARLARHHGDPFDRMLIAQAQLESLTLVTRDAGLAAYGVPLLAA
jgi:PIN domain nuclease of toxin-antitoxin system